MLIIAKLSTNKERQAMQSRGISENLIAFKEELAQKFPKYNHTSDFRKGAKTSEGKDSRHAHGEALDYSPNLEVKDYLWNTSDGISLLNKYNLGFIDETLPENKKFGNAYHFGTDTIAVNKAKERYNKLVGKQQNSTNITGTPTSNITNLQIPQNNATFADVPDVYKEGKEAEVVDAKKQLAESSFIEDYKQAQQEQYQQQIDEQSTPIMKTDVYGIAQNVENAVSGGVAQEGGSTIKDNNGYWNPANQGKIVQIDGGNITMNNVYEPLIGVSDKGEKQYMLPGQNYNFKNAKTVTEYPVITDRERAFIQQYKNKR